MSNAQPDFLKGYIAAALWSSFDRETDEPLNVKFDEEDLAPATLSRMQADCFDFQSQNEALLAKAYPLMQNAENGPAFRAGFCFWLDRNDHGDGFLAETALREGGIGESLSKACDDFGTCDLFVGDDGKLHLQ